MVKEDLEKTLKYFSLYEWSYNKDEVRTIDCCYQQVNTKGMYWSNNMDSDFEIVVLEDDSVYQVGTEADTIGVELKTFEELRIRFESFTGEKLSEKKYDKKDS